MRTRTNLTGTLASHEEFILAAIELKARNGLEILNALNKVLAIKVMGHPTLYKTLASLQERGYVHATPDGRSTIYSITEGGRRALTHRRELLEEVKMFNLEGIGYAAV